MAIDLGSIRPYAKAIFALALRDQNFYQWQNVLNVLAIIATECKKNSLLNNPNIGRKKELDFFYEASEKFPMAYNLVCILADKKKLEILPDIAFVYQQLLLGYEKTLEAKIVATRELTVMQKERLIKALQERYQHKILLQCQIDPKLIGGAVIYISGQIIDGSIKGMLQRLKQNL